MGQRLVVTIQSGKRDICALHYHWGAYPFDSVMLLDEIVQELMKIGKKKAGASDEDIQLAMILFAEKNGGGISGGKNGSEWKYVKNVFPEEKFKADGINRNNGLIAISPEEICSLNNWADGVANIDLEAQEITNWTVETVPSYLLKAESLPLSVSPESYSMDESGVLAKEVSPAKDKETCFRYGEYNFIF